MGDVMEMHEVDVMTFEEICDGEALREVNEQLAKLQADITDRRKKAKAPRELQIKIKITCDDRRNVESIDLQVVPKLAPFDEGRLGKYFW